MERFGDQLRMERENRQMSLDSICAMTKVSLRHLEALENNKLAELPGGVFRKGILRGYLRALDLEEAPWMERLEAELHRMGADAASDNDWVEFAENVRRNRGEMQSGSSARWLGVAAMLIAVVVLGWGVWKFVLHGHLAL